MIHSYVRHDSSICETWLIPTWEVRHDSFILSCWGLFPRTLWKTRHRRENRTIHAQGATNYRAFWREKTCKDKASYTSLPPGITRNPFTTRDLFIILFIIILFIIILWLAIYAQVVCGMYLSLHIAHSMSEWALCHPVWRHIIVARTVARFCSRPKPKETYMREKRRTHQKRDSWMRKKTYLWEKRHICAAPAQIQKRHVCEKRDLHTTKETIIREKRDSYMRKKTCL